MTWSSGCPTGIFKPCGSRQATIWTCSGDSLSLCAVTENQGGPGFLGPGLVSMMRRSRKSFSCFNLQPFFSHTENRLQNVEKKNLQWPSELLFLLACVFKATLCFVNGCVAVSGYACVCMGTYFMFSEIY